MDRRAFLAFGFGSVAALAFKGRAAPNPHKPPPTTTTTTTTTVPPSSGPGLTGILSIGGSSVGGDLMG